MKCELCFCSQPFPHQICWFLKNFLFWSVIGFSLCLTDAAFSSDSSSPENVEDSGLDSPSHQPIGVSPEPTGWAAWPSTQDWPSKDSVNLSRSSDPFLAAFCNPSPGQSHFPQDNATNAWPSNLRSPRAPTDVEPTTFSFPAFSHSLASSELEPSVWSCKHIPPEDPFLDAFERSAPKNNLPPLDAWAPPAPRPTRDGRGVEGHTDPFSISLNDTKTLPPSSSSRKDRDRKRERSVPPPESPDDPFAITMVGSPTHQSSLAAQAAAQGRASSNRPTPSPNSAPSSQPKKELVHWNSVHNPFSESTTNNTATQESTRKQRSFNDEPRRNGPPLTRHSGPQEDLCFSTDKDQNFLDINTQPGIIVYD